MEIKECKSHEYIMQEIKQKLVEITDKVQENYKKELSVYKYNYCSTQYLAELTINHIKILGMTVTEDKEYKNILSVSFDDRKLEVYIIDQSEFLYSLVKEEFTKFAETNKDSIKSLCFVKDFNLENS